jgi:uncharacterized protein DUF6424
MPAEKIGDTIEIETADHPPRTDSPEYIESRKWLMGQAGGGCVICGGPVDMSHPGVGDATSLQDHHGGGIYVVTDGVPVLVALNLFPMEWSEGFGSDPSVVSGMVANLNTVRKTLGQQTYEDPITDTNSVMAYVDSVFNANVKLCAPHHVGHLTQHTPDANGHEAVGIHNVPFPIVAYQLFCDWKNWDMFAGTTGTLAVAPVPGRPGHAQVLNVAPEHPESVLYEKQASGHSIVLTPKHPAAQAAAKTAKFAVR